MTTLGPTVAGRWYPADRPALEAQLDGLFAGADLADVSTGPGGAVRALIAPHAGFPYSGEVAARGFRRLGPESFSRVILLGPSHFVPFDGAAIPAASAYRTPLGEIALDVEAITRLGADAGFHVDDAPFRPEHALEAEMPFLQRCLAPGFRMVPVLLGRLSTAAARQAVAEALRPLLGSETLVVVSSDFTHYGPRFDFVPFDTEVPAGIERLDMGAVERILAWDLPGFEEYLSRSRATICGRNAIRVLLDLFPPGLAGDLAAYDTSGRLTGDWEHSVSYASLVFRKSEP